MNVVKRTGSVVVVKEIITDPLEDVDIMDTTATVTTDQSGAENIVSTPAAAIVDPISLAGPTVVVAPEEEGTIGYHGDEYIIAFCIGTLPRTQAGKEARISQKQNAHEEEDVIATGLQEIHGELVEVRNGLHKVVH
jgi:hypothetical protein